MKNSLIIVSLAALMACGGNGSPSRDESSVMAVSKETENEVAFKQVVNIPTERKLIKTGQINFRVESVEKTKLSIDQVCKEFQGYISSEQQNNLGDRLQHTIVVRVPAANYDLLSGKIEALAVQMDNKNVNVQDVTEEFVDASARVKTKKELSARYHEILKEARTVTDILAVESQIGNIQAEIESMEGRLKYLGDQVSFSTLTVTYYENIGVNYGFASKFVGAIKSGWENLLEFIILIVNMWPFFLLFGGGYWLFAKWRKRRNKVPHQG